MLGKSRVKRDQCSKPSVNSIVVHGLKKGTIPAMPAEPEIKPRHQANLGEMIQTISKSGCGRLRWRLHVSPNAVSR